MKFSSITVFATLLVTCSAAAVDYRDNNDEFSLTNVIGLMSRISRFRKLVQVHIDDGSISKDSFKEPFKMAIKSTTECFGVEFAKFNGTFLNLAQAFQKAINPASETKPGPELATAQPVNMVQRFVQLFLSYMNAYQSPDFQAAIKQLKQKFEEAALESQDCFATKFLSQLPDSEAKLVKDLWKESEKDEKNPTDGVVE